MKKEELSKSPLLTTTLKFIKYTSATIKPHQASKIGFVMHMGITIIGFCYFSWKMLSIGNLEVIVTNLLSN